MTVRLSDAQLERLADLVAERLQPSSPQAVGAVAQKGPSLVDASALARRLGVSRATVYEHSAELGAIEVGGGKRPRLRFDPEKAVERMDSPLCQRRVADRSNPHAY